MRILSQSMERPTQAHKRLKLRAFTGVNARSSAPTRKLDSPLDSAGQSADCLACWLYSGNVNPQRPRPMEEWSGQLLSTGGAFGNTRMPLCKRADTMLRPLPSGAPGAWMRWVDSCRKGDIRACRVGVWPPLLVRGLRLLCRRICNTSFVKIGAGVYSIADCA